MHNVYVPLRNFYEYPQFTDDESVRVTRDSRCPRYFETVHL